MFRNRIQVMYLQHHMIWTCKQSGGIIFGPINNSENGSSKQLFIVGKGGEEVNKNYMAPYFSKNQIWALSRDKIKE